MILFTSQLLLSKRTIYYRYWDLYFELNQIIVEAFAAKGVQAPALRVLNEKA